MPMLVHSYTLLHFATPRKSLRILLVRKADTEITINTLRCCGCDYYVVIMFLCFAARARNNAIFTVFVVLAQHTG